MAVQMEKIEVAHRRVATQTKRVPLKPDWTPSSRMCHKCGFVYVTYILIGTTAALVTQCPYRSILRQVLAK